MTTVSDARDLLLGHARTALGLPDELVSYTDAPVMLPDDEHVWARITAKHADGGQTGMGDFKKKYTAIGVLCIEVFAKQGSGLQLGDDIAQTARSGLESVGSSPIRYRNIRIADAGRDGGFVKVNVYAEFEYDYVH